MTVSTAVTGSATLVWNGVDAFDVTVPYTVAAGADIIVVSITAPWLSLTAVTYNSVGLTNRIIQDDGDASTAQLYDLLSPTTGLNDLVISYAGSAISVNYAIYTISGLDLGTPRGTPYTTSGFLGSVSNAFTTVVDDVIVDVLSIKDTSTATIGAGQTIGLNASAGLAAYLAYSSTEVATTTSTTMSWTISPSATLAYGAQPYNLVAGGLTLDSAPSTMAKAETGVSFVVSAPATAPTTGNTTVINSGDALTVTSVTGSDPYTINCTVPLAISKQAGSYAWTVTVDAENVVSASIPLTVQAGWSNIVLASPLTTSGYMLEGYTGAAPVTGDTMEYETTADLVPETTSEWVWTTAPTVSQVVNRRVIQVDGTVGTTEPITFTVAVAISSGILRNVLRSPLKDILRLSVR